MEFDINFLGGAASDPDARERWADALARPRPALMESAREAIDDICANRIRNLTANRYDVVEIFCALENLPPAGTWLLESFLDIGASIDFNLDLLQARADDERTAGKPQKTESSADEWGYVELPLSLEIGAEMRLMVDAQAVRRDTLKVIGDLFVHFGAIMDPELRAALVEDCRNVAKLRLNLDVTKSGR